MGIHRVKLVATIGPASDSEEALKKLMLDGVDIFRINFSHSTPKYANNIIKIINKLNLKLKKNTGVFIDLPGPKIRTGFLPKGSLDIKEGKKYTFGPSGDIPVSEEVVHNVDRKKKILLSDGKIELKPVKLYGDKLIVRAMNSATLLDRQSVNALGLKYEKGYPTKEDISAIRFGLKHGIRTFALSFVSKKEDIIHVRKITGKDSTLIAKIERKEAVENFEEIASLSDVLMIARGDLGLNMDVAEVPEIQKKLIISANRMSKPVITATQMLESMTENIMPTRAEVDDVFTAISEGTDAVMLSEETAIGQHPYAAVRMLSHIIAMSKSVAATANYPAVDERDALIDATVSLIQKTGIKDVVVLTKSGRSAFRLARFHLGIRIFAVTDSKSVLCALAFGRSITPVYIDKLSGYPTTVLKKIKAENNLKEVILVTGFKTSNRAVEGMRIIKL